MEKGLGGAQLLAKAEWANPGGSVKDRAASRMIMEGIRTGHLLPGMTILDATSGNTGIAYAMLGAALGYPVKLCVPESVNTERRRTLLALGAELVFTDPMDGSDGAILKASALHAENPVDHFYPDQYGNEFNWRAHFDTTGPEIWEETRGTVTHFIAGIGTTGTIVGTGRFLKSMRSDVRVVGVQPDSGFHGLEGLKHLESAIVPPIYDPSIVDEHVFVTTEDAHDMVKQVAKKEGILVGISSGAALVAAVRIAKNNPERVVVIVFPDSGTRYLSERFWD